MAPLFFQSNLITNKMVEAPLTATKNPSKAAKKKGKKRKISQHILAAGASAGTFSTSKDAQALPVQDTPGAATTKLLAKKKRKRTQLKDPGDAAAYLTAWKLKKNDWKFNKNTQSWLIRHMYDAEKIPKGVFSNLVEYLAAAGETTMVRIVQEATRRALRYQTHSNSSAVTSVETKDPTDTAIPVNSVDTDDATRWKNMNDHDKRKEYKRARKVLDSLSSLRTSTEK